MTIRNISIPRGERSEKVSVGVVLELKTDCHSGSSRKQIWLCLKVSVTSGESVRISWVKGEMGRAYYWTAQGDEEGLLVVSLEAVGTSELEEPFGSYHVLGPVLGCSGVEKLGRHDVSMAMRYLNRLESMAYIKHG